eukprot:GHVN01002115.1.p1 GENE.GHVN01002115.1~~GHVN01002115.1.p1  ORF type:complete len:1060 (-),score=97.41 GHVN01002115.1:170-3349(-)
MEGYEPSGGAPSSVSGDEGLGADQQRAAHAAQPDMPPGVAKPTLVAPQQRPPMQQGGVSHQAAFQPGVLPQAFSPRVGADTVSSELVGGHSSLVKMEAGLGPQQVHTIQTGGHQAGPAYSMAQHPQPIQQQQTLGSSPHGSSPQPVSALHPAQLAANHRQAVMVQVTHQQVGQHTQWPTRPKQLIQQPGQVGAIRPVPDGQIGQQADPNQAPSSAPAPFLASQMFTAKCSPPSGFQPSGDSRGPHSGGPQPSPTMPPGMQGPDWSQLRGPPLAAVGPQTISAVHGVRGGGGDHQLTALRNQQISAAAFQAMQKEKRLAELAASADDRRFPDLAKFRGVYGPFAGWCSECLEECRMELLEVCFIVFVDLWLRLFENSREQAAIFLEEFHEDHMARHAIDVDQMKASTDFGQLMNLEVTSQFFNGGHFHVCLSRMARRLLALKLTRDKSGILQSIIFERLKIHSSQPKGPGGGQHKLMPGVAFTHYRGRSPGRFRISGAVSQNMPVEWGLAPEEIGEEDTSMVNNLVRRFSRFDGERTKQQRRNTMPGDMEGKTSPTTAPASSAAGTSAAPSSEREAERPGSIQGIPRPAPDSWIAQKWRRRYVERISRRAPVTSSQLPTSLCYSFHNASELSSVCINRSNGSLIAAGYENSSIRLWNLDVIERLKGLSQSAREVSKGKSAPLENGNRFKSRLDVGADGGRDTPLSEMSNSAFVAPLRNEGFGSQMSPSLGVPFSGSPVSFHNPLAPTGTFDSPMGFDSAVSPPVDASWDGEGEEADAKELHAILENPDPLVRSYLIGHKGAVFALEFSEDDRLLYSGGLDSQIRCWSVEGRLPLAIYRSHSACIWSIDCSNLGHFFVTGSADGSARLWATDRSFALRMFVGHTADVDIVRYHPNSALITTGSTDHTVRLWDVRSAQCCRTFVGHCSAVQALAVSPNGRLIASAGQGSSDAIVWDIPSGTTVGTLRGHHHRIAALDFAHESEVLASGGMDGSVQMWDVKAVQDEPPASFQGVRASQGPRKRLRQDYSLENLARWKLRAAKVHTLRFTGQNLLLLGASTLTI